MPHEGGALCRPAPSSMPLRMFGSGTSREPIRQRMIDWIPSCDTDRCIGMAASRISGKATCLLLRSFPLFPLFRDMLGWCSAFEILRSEGRMPKGILGVRTSGPCDHPEDKRPHERGANNGGNRADQRDESADEQAYADAKKN